MLQSLLGSDIIHFFLCYLNLTTFSYTQNSLYNICVCLRTHIVYGFHKTRYINFILIIYLYIYIITFDFLLKIYKIYKLILFSLNQHQQFYLKYLRVKHIVYISYI